MTLITYPLSIHPVLHWAAGPASRALLNLKPKLTHNFLAVVQIRELSNHLLGLIMARVAYKGDILDLFSSHDKQLLLFYPIFKHSFGSP